MRRAALLVLLLALLIPFRGALAVTGVFCHAADVPSGAASHAAVHHHHADGVGVDAHDDAPAPTSGTDGGNPSAGACTTCCPSCSAPTLAAASTGLQMLRLAGAERFPALPLARAAAFPGRLERPPRAI